MGKKKKKKRKSNSAARRRKRALKRHLVRYWWSYIIGVVVVLVLPVYLLTSVTKSFANKASDYAISHVVSRLEDMGWYLKGVRCGSVSLNIGGSIACNNMYGKVLVKEPKDLRGQYFLSIGELGVSFQDQGLSLLVKEVELDRESRANFSFFSKVDDSLSIRVRSVNIDRFVAFVDQNIELNNVEGLRTLLGSTMNKIYRLATHGETSQSIKLVGDVEFFIHDRRGKLAFRVVPVDGVHRLIVDPRTLSEFAELFDEGLNQTEAELFSQHPLKVVKLLQIKREARRVSERVGRHYFDIPEDAYRHILWSFKLTKEFGAEFAEKVTDAHEADLSLDTRDKVMDIKNNELGRLWAEEGVKENDLLGLVKSDERVVWKK